MTSIWPYVVLAVSMEQARGVEDPRDKAGTIAPPETAEGDAEEDEVQERALWANLSVWSRLHREGSHHERILSMFW